MEHEPFEVSEARIKFGDSTWVGFHQSELKKMIGLADLIKQRDRLVEYLKLKVEMNDWHGVADAAMDLREVEAQMTMFRQVGPVERKNEADY